MRCLNDTFLRLSGTDLCLCVCEPQDNHPSDHPGHIPDCLPNDLIGWVTQQSNTLLVYRNKHKRQHATIQQDRAVPYIHTANFYALGLSMAVASFYAPVAMDTLGLSVKVASFFASGQTVA